MIDFARKSVSGSTFSGSKQTLGFDAAASEKDRLKGAMAARAKNEKERARQQVADFQRRVERNKAEISSRQTEIKRLSQEIFHAEAEIHGLEDGLKVYDSRGGDSKIRVHNFDQQLQNKQKEAIFQKKQIDEKRHEESKLQSELTELQRKIAENRRAVGAAEQKVREIEMEMHHLEGSKQKNTGDAEHASSDRAYKQKEIDNKQKLMDSLDQKRKVDTEELARLLADNKKLEVDIQILQSKFK